MAKTRMWLDPFNRDLDFVAAHAGRIGGREYRAGEPIDKAALPDRTLRTLYEARTIIPTERVPGRAHQR